METRVITRPAYCGINSAKQSRPDESRPLRASICLAATYDTDDLQHYPPSGALHFKPKLVSLPCRYYSIHHRYPLDSHPLCPTKSPNLNSKRRNRHHPKANSPSPSNNRNSARNSAISGMTTAAASNIGGRNRPHKNNDSHARSSNGANARKTHSGLLSNTPVETRKSASLSLSIMKRALSKNFINSSATR